MSDVMLAGAEHACEVDAFSDPGTERERNEDACGTAQDERGTIVAVADGVSSNAAGETASRTAIDALLRGWREAPPDLPAPKRLARAFQRANIEVYELATTVPELRGMATTLTAAVVHQGVLAAAHVGDSRLYLVRGGTISQLTKDHTVAAEQVRLGLLSEERARRHPGRSTLTRCIGRELIVAIDRISLPLARGDALLLCSDGLYNVLAEREFAGHVGDPDAARACRSLVEAANSLGTYDNVTAAVVRLTGSVPERPRQPSVGAKLRRIALGWLGPRRQES
jgi:PPM family protein phosphatase